MIQRNIINILRLVVIQEHKLIFKMFENNNKKQVQSAGNTHITASHIFHT